MKFIETLKHSAYVQCQAFFFAELQKALGTKAEQLLHWLAFDPILLDLESDETVFIHRLELPTFELLPFSEQLEFAYGAAADISQQYPGIHAVLGYDEDGGIIVVYLSSEDVTLEAIETLMHSDDEDDQQTPRKASVHALSLVPNGKAPTAPVEAATAPSEPVAAPTLAESADDTEEEEPEAFETETPDDAPADEPFNEEMLTVEQIEALDTLRKDADAVAFIRNALLNGVAQFDSFVEFNDVSDFPMSVVYDVLEQYEQFKAPANSDVAQIFGDDQPDSFDVEEAPDEFPTEEEPAHDVPETVAEAEPARTAPMGGEREVAKEITEALISEADEHKARFAQILQDVASQLPDDSLSEIADGGLNIIMSRVVPNENGVGMKDVDYNLRLTIRREMFAGIKEIDKYRLENNGELIVETGSLQVILENLNNL